MKFYIFLVLFYIAFGRQINHADNIDLINQESQTWEAGHNEWMEGKTLEDVKQYLGWRGQNAEKTLAPYPYEINADLPASFDSRTKWPKLIGPVLNQADCGSCWAFGGVEAISDRTAIKNGTTFVQLSPLSVVTCDTSMDGCNGGEAGSTWEYAQNNGLVTMECLPYNQADGGPIPTCAPEKQPCLTFVNTPSCTQQCTNGQAWNPKYSVSSVYGVNGEEQYMTELASNGPFEVCFSVYSDFVHYKSGVYKRSPSASYLGGHCVKVIGYGTLNGTPYWTVQNSWTTTWGDNGYFLIYRGDNECGIEQSGVAGKI